MGVASLQRPVQVRLREPCQPNTHTLTHAHTHTLTHSQTTLPPTTVWFTGHRPVQVRLREPCRGNTQSLGKHTFVRDTHHRWRQRVRGDENFVGGKERCFDTSTAGRHARTPAKAVSEGKAEREHAHSGDSLVHCMLKYSQRGWLVQTRPAAMHAPLPRLCRAEAPATIAESLTKV